MIFFTALRAVSWLAIAFAAQQTAPDYPQHLVGQRLIFRHYAETANPKAREADLARKKGGCDEAVEVIRVALGNSSIRLTLRNVGEPIVRKKITGCSRQAEVYSFTISDFAFDQPHDQAEDAFAHVLQTPEAYLASFGVSWNPVPQSGVEPPVNFPGPGLTAPEALLSVTPSLGEASSKAPIGGAVTMRCVLGTDGLLHDPVITKGFGDSINERALEALAFWRLEPIRKDSRPVAATITVGVSFLPF